MPAIRLNANDVRRGTGGTALRRLRISSTNVAQIITREAYAKVMGWHSTQVWGRLLYRSLSCLTAILKACINEDGRALVRGTNRHTENPSDTATAAEIGELLKENGGRQEARTPTSALRTCVRRLTQYGIPP
jgi:hypothetical protein